MRLTVENGCFAYPGAPELLLKGIEFQAQSGDILAILGPNGAGKTTLLRCIIGFLKWKEGKSALDGADIRALSYKKLWRQIAYVPQAKHAAAAYTVEETILLGRSNRIGPFSSPGRADIDKTDEVIRRLHIEKLRGRRCSEISGGELQMVLIAKALAAEPGMLILDEPESNLDFKNQLIVLETMSELAASGMACVFNTHFPAHALQRSNKALLLGRDGRALFGDSHGVITEANIERAFGVKAVIGEIETPGSIMRDVLPLGIANGQGSTLKLDDMSANKLAVIAIITRDYANGERINSLLHDFSGMLVGRMGMPYHERGAYIINITVDAPAGDIQALLSRLRMMPNTSIKTTFAPEGSATGESL